ncbi:aldose 1-epimerase [Alkalibacterium subtropicum]|uniref:Aldose 1-epimerase n=1 Tax=Alkalibacterium subtropicum TaxID=753702 RepID=A0A1I1KDK9_9LACT|nr:aldose epimerase family protein [Alkalibacterium subtropicum]SFC55640.1 aldose 1-epimerase [Alkalibacterium subtropicum]
MELTKKVFGQFKNKDVYEYTLTNEAGIAISAIPFGATLTKLVTPDKKGKRENITLNVESLEDFVRHRPFYGATIGRVAGRITKGKFSIDGKEYQVDINEGDNMLHGGPKGLDTKLWTIEVDESAGQLVFTYESKAGENGFPGTMQIKVTYTLTEGNDWVIDYEATTDEATLFNPTNHVYFNLTGDIKQPILDHQLELASSQYIPLAEENLPSEEKASVEGTPFDFQTAKPLKEAVLSDHEQIKQLAGLDHPFVLDKAQDQKGVLYEPESGREVSVYTDRNSAVVFTHNGEVDDYLIEGEPAKQYAGITLETQTLPDAINKEGFGDIILRPGETFRSRTTYHFGTRD